MNNKTRHQSSVNTLARQTAITLLTCLAMMLSITASPHPTLAQDQDVAVLLKSRQFMPAPGVEQAVQRQQQVASPDERIHVLVQFWQIPSDSERASLENAGVDLLAYVPTNTWFASMPAGANLQSETLAITRWIGAIQPEDRMAPTLQARQGARVAHDDGTVSLDLRFFSDVTSAEVSQIIAEYNGVIETKAPEFHRFTVRVDPESIDALASEDGIQWIADAAPPKTTDNDGSRARTNVDALHGASYNLSGNDVDLGIWDGGVVDNHVDFSGRLTVVDTSASVDSHATHVAGTMAGDGSNSTNQGGTPFQWKGMAPGADIISYYWDSNLTDHNDAINTYGIELSQNSWGYTISEFYFGNCYLYGDYDYDAPDYDDIITGLYGRRINVVFAAGNERDDGDCGMSSTPPYINYASLGPPATAKNIIAVGATNSDDDTMTTFSSWGPMDDGRIKPDVVAPGCEAGGEGYIRSTLPGNTYGNPAYCGTSMAAPAVSGISGLIIEQYRASYGADPLPSTVKALLIQTAVDMDDGTVYYNPGPDFSSGYGRVDAQAAVDEIIAQHIREDQISNGQTDSFTFDVPAGTPSLKVTLAWDDEPGAVNASPALVNNLDLVLVEPNGTTTHLPWVLDPANPSNNATTGTDSVNNVEQVQVDNPAAGTWEARVVGTSVPAGPQRYSLVGQPFTSGQTGNVGPLQYHAHTIDDDNNGNSSGNDDGDVNPGETIELFVELLNIGTDEAQDVYVTSISTTSPYVTIIFNTSSGYGNIPGSGTATNIDDFDFVVSGTAPDGHVIHFELDITASNGGPWSTSFDVPVVDPGSGGVSVALISDQSELQAITPILDSMGLSYDVMNNNWDGAQGIYTSDYGFLSNYNIVVWYASGSGTGRLITQQEHDALEQFLQAGGRLLASGYDTLGSPSDPLLADLVRSADYGDGPFTYDYTVTDGTHPIMNGPYGSFPTGTALMAGHVDHDQAEADTTRGAVTVAELSGGFDKIIATELASAGKVVYWNGNSNAQDWIGQTPTAASVESELKRDAAGQTPPTNEELAARAKRLDSVSIPPEANFGGDGVALQLDTGAIPVPAADIVPLASESVTFIATGDTVSVASNPYWWHAGDFAEGTRTLSLSSVEHVDYTLYIGSNGLSGSGHVEFDLSINGVVVGSFTVFPGEMVKNVSFHFAPIAGPTYTIRLEETNTVDTGMGSITLPADLSTMVLSKSDPEILQNTLNWLAQGTDGPDEPNDTPSQCTTILFDVPIANRIIDPPGDYDYYCFTGSSGQHITADIDAWMIGSPLDPVLTLFDSDGSSVLLENDDYDGLDSYLDYILPHDGTFYLRVRDFGTPDGGPGYFYSILLSEITLAVDAPWSDDMESGINNWTFNGFWHQVEDGASPYPESHSPTHSWWYGQDATGDYENGSANAGSLTSPSINIPADATGASLSFWSWYETEPLILPQNIYFDGYHDSDGDDNISGGIYTDWASKLSALGNTVTEHNQPIDAAALSGYHVLALFDPEIALSPAEISAINDFMQNGGRVVLLGEWNDIGGTNTILNAVSAAHGITLNSDTVSDSTDNDGQAIWPLIYNFDDDHPLVRGVNTVVLYASCSLSLSSSAVPLATGDGDTTAMVAVGDFSGASEASDDIGLTASQFVQPLDIVPGAPTVMAYASVGDGELMVIGDSGLWTSEDPDGDGISCIDEHHSAILSSRVFGKEVDHHIWDRKWVQLSVDNGPFQNLLQVTGLPMREWHELTLDLSPYIGSQVRVRFHFDTIDSIANYYRGWYIDDFSLDATTAPPPGPIVYESQIIDDDNSGQSSGNGDGIAHAGETIELFCELRNHGPAPANNVEACISENDPYVNSFLYNTCSNYGVIPDGGTATNPDDFDFSISSSAPAGRVINFTLDVTADNGGPWTTSCDVTVGQPPQPPGPVLYQDRVIDDDSSGQSVGNNDGQINPGETIELYVELLNAGLGTANAVNGCLSEGSPYVDGFLFNDCAYYADILGGGTALNAADFDFEVDINAPHGHVIPFTITATASNGGPWTDTFSIGVVGGSGTRLHIEPPDQDAPLNGGSFVVEVMVDDVNSLGAFEFDLVYDSAIVHVVDVDLGPFLGSTGRSVSEVGPVIDNMTGRTSYGAFSFGGGSGPSGTGTLAIVTLTPTTLGESDLVLENELLTDVDGGTILSTASNGHVWVTDCFFADVNCDEQVNIADIQIVASHYGCILGDSCYEPIYDMDNDDDVDIVDLQIVACYWGWPNGDFSICYTPTVLGEEPLEGGIALQSSTVWIEPDTYASGGPGEVFTVTVEIAGAKNLGAFQFDMNFDPSLVQANNVMLGDFLGSTGRTAYEVGPSIDNTLGTVNHGAFTLGPSPNGPDGDGTLATITLETRAAGTITFDMDNVEVVDVSGQVQSSEDIYLPIIIKGN